MTRRTRTKPGLSSSDVVITRHVADHDVHRLSGLEAVEVGKCECALGTALNWRLWIFCEVFDECVAPSQNDQPPDSPPRSPRYKILQDSPAHSGLPIQSPWFRRSNINTRAQHDSERADDLGDEEIHQWAETETPALKLYVSVDIDEPLVLIGGGMLHASPDSNFGLHVTTSPIHLLAYDPEVEPDLEWSYGYDEVHLWAQTPPPELRPSVSGSMAFVKGGTPYASPDSKFSLWLTTSPTPSLTYGSEAASYSEWSYGEEGHQWAQTRPFKPRADVSRPMVLGDGETLCASPDSMFSQCPSTSPTPSLAYGSKVAPNSEWSRGCKGVQLWAQTQPFEPHAAASGPIVLVEGGTPRASPDSLLSQCLSTSSTPLLTYGSKVAPNSERPHGCKGVQRWAQTSLPPELHVSGRKALDGGAPHASPVSELSSCAVLDTGAGA